MLKVEYIFKIKCIQFIFITTYLLSFLDVFWTILTIFSNAENRFCELYSSYIDMY